MPPPDPTIDDEEDQEYASSEDSDFAPDAPDAAAGPDASDDDDDESGDDAGETTAATASTSRKRKKAVGKHGDAAGAEEDEGFENSGDEAIIEKGRKRRRKQAKGKNDDDEEGGEGGLIKTRSMRAVEKAERKTKAAEGPVTVDVDALWASMTAAPVVPTTATTSSQRTTDDNAADPPKDGTAGDANNKSAEEPPATIKIKRSYVFAGKVHTETKVVARDSAEARLYLASKGGDDAGNNDEQAEEDEEDDANRRMPRKAFRSAFEPVIVTVGSDGAARTDLNLSVTGLRARRDEGKAHKKLNTVEKSRVDWAGFVDGAGIQDELAAAGRAKGSYAEREGFLARTEARREEDARRVRLAGKV